MKISTTIRRISLAALAVICFSAASSALAALRYESVTTTEAEGQKPMRTVNEAWIEGDKARIEFRDSANPMMPAGSYVVTVDGGATMFLINPAEKTYAEWDLEELFATVGALMEGMSGMVDIEVSDLAVEKVAEEPGPALHGYGTTHYRYHTTYTMTMKIMGMSRPSTVERTQDLWTTGELEELVFAAWLQKAPRTGLDDIDALIESEMSKVQGVPLKMEETTVTTGKKGKRESRSQTSMEVTEIERGVSVPASHFEVPEGYTRTEVMAGVETGEDDEKGGNPFRRILGGGR